jgi:hypothetical protein|tara:strand:- start:21058 stop:21858 length:801 start_codon:yes stop_codon:yes gene_type:complete
MKQFLFLTTFVISGFTSYAQVVYGEPTDKESAADDKSLTSPATKLTDYKSRLILGVGNSLFTDFITSPLTYTTIEFQDPPISPGGPNVIRLEPAAVQTSYGSIYSLSIEPRYNILEPTDNFSFAALAPTSIGFGQSGPSDQSVQGIFGFGNLQLDLLATVYYGYNATIRSEGSFGVHFGVGYELNKIGLINLEPALNSGNLNKAWIMPVTRVGVQLYRGSPLELYVKYGFGQRVDQLIDGNGNDLNEGKIVRRASSLKLAIVYVIN